MNKNYMIVLLKSVLISIILLFLIIATEYFHFIEYPPKEFTVNAISGGYTSSHIDWYVAKEASRGVTGTPTVEGYLAYQFYNSSGFATYILLVIGVFLAFLSITKLQSINHLGWKRIIFLISIVSGAIFGINLWQENEHLFYCILGGSAISVATLIIIFILNFIFFWVKAGFDSPA